MHERAIQPRPSQGESIKWRLVSYTAFVFSLVAVHVATSGHVLPVSYIDNRDFPGKLNPGLYGYQVRSRRTRGGYKIRTKRQETEGISVQTVARQKFV